MVNTQAAAGKTSTPVVAVATPKTHATVTVTVNNKTTAPAVGNITEFPIPGANSTPDEIAAGYEGSLWFTELSGNQIGRITPGGTITEFPIPTANSNLNDITAGPDGNLWFTEYDGNKIGRITSGR